jgi:hypothetical protein
VRLELVMSAGTIDIMEERKRKKKGTMAFSRRRE